MNGFVGSTSGVKEFDVKETSNSKAGRIGCGLAAFRREGESTAKDTGCSKAGSVGSGVVTQRGCWVKGREGCGQGGDVAHPQS